MTVPLGHSLVLEAGPWRAEVAPQLGGALLVLERDGYPLFRPGALAALSSCDVRRSGCFPMVPYCNRIAFGRFNYEGAAYELALDLQGDPHALHGVGWRRPWVLLHADRAGCVLELKHRPDGKLARDWPFAFTARQTFQLGQEGLCTTLSLTSDQSGPAPAGLGLHPLFRRRAGESVRFFADHAWRNSDDMLPVAPVSGAPFDYEAGKVLDGVLVDHDFSAWRGWARFEAPGEPAVTLRADPIFGALRVFAPPGRDFFAVEPMTHETNALNRTGAVLAMENLAPGQRLEGRVWIELEPRR